MDEVQRLKAELVSLLGEAAPKSAEILSFRGDNSPIYFDHSQGRPSRATLVEQIKDQRRFLKISGATFNQCVLERFGAGLRQLSRNDLVEVLGLLDMVASAAEVDSGGRPRVDSACPICSGAAATQN